MCIRVVYSLHAEKQPGPDWPNVGFDFKPVMERIDAALAAGCPELEFVSSMATGPEQAAEILTNDATAGIDGYIIYQMNCWNRVVQTLATSNKPVLYADFQYGGSGGFLVYTAGFLRSRAPNVGFVASSRMEDLVAAARCFPQFKAEAASGFAAAIARIRVRRTAKHGDLACAPDPQNSLVKYYLLHLWYFLPSPFDWTSENMRNTTVIVVK